MDSATFFPAEEAEPRFIGARTGHSPIRMHCGTCGFVGTSQVRSVAGSTTVALGLPYVAMPLDHSVPGQLQCACRPDCMRLQYSWLAPLTD